MKLDELIQSPIYNRDSVSVNSVFLLSSYVNIPFMIFLLLLLRKKHFSSALLLVFSCGSSGKESACNVGDLGSMPGLGRFPWRREQLPTPVFWPGEFHGLYSPWGCKRLGMTEQLSLTCSLEEKP